MVHHRFEVTGAYRENLSDLNHALRDPDAAAIITTRGGKRAYRIADQMISWFSAKVVGKLDPRGHLTAVIG